MELEGWYTVLLVDSTRKLERVVLNHVEKGEGGEEEIHQRNHRREADIDILERN